MNWLMTFLVRLYPRVWRARYEAEFAALLEDVKPSWGTTLDILRRGLALQMQTASFGMIVAGLGLAGLVAGLGVWRAMPAQFVSQVTLQVQAREAGDGKAMPERANRAAQYLFRNKQLSAIVKEDNIYPAELARKPMEDVLAEMRDSITIRPGRAVALPAGAKPFSVWPIDVSFRYRDPEVAERVAQDLALRLDFLCYLEGETGGRFSGSRVIADTALSGAREVRANIWLYGAMGVTVGVMAGVGVGWWRGRSRAQLVG
jgi:hypothetical protein